MEITRYQQAAITNVVRFLQNVPRHRDVEANELFILHALAAQNKAASPENISAIYPHIKHQLAEHSDYTLAYRELRAAHPEFAFTEADTGLLDATLVRRGEDVTFENLEDLLQPGNPDYIALETTVAYKQAQADDAERAAIIKQLTSVKPQIDGRGRKVTYDIDGRIVDYALYIEAVKNLSLAELRSVRDKKAERSRLKGLGAADLRKIVQQPIGDARRIPQTGNESKALWDSRFQKLPATYVPTCDGDRNRFRAGESIELNRKNVMSLHRDDLHTLIRKHGADAVNAIIRGEANAN